MDSIEISRTPIHEPTIVRIIDIKNTVERIFSVTTALKLSPSLVSFQVRKAAGL